MRSLIGFLFPSEHILIQMCILAWCSNFSKSSSKGYPTAAKPAVNAHTTSFLSLDHRHTVIVVVTFSCPYLLHVEPHVQYLKMKFCSFGSRYAGTGWQLEKAQTVFYRHESITAVNTVKPQLKIVFG